MVGKLADGDGHYRLAFATHYLSLAQCLLQRSVVAVEVERQDVKLIVGAGVQTVDGVLLLALESLSAELLYHLAHVGEAEHRTPLVELCLALTLGEDGDVVAAYVLVRHE